MGRDLIHINDLLLRTIIGVNEDERHKKQDVLINITLYTDHSAAVTDNLVDTIDYSLIARQVSELVENSQYLLVEKLATEITKVCLADLRVERAVVRVEKPMAVRFTRSVGVTVDRERADVGIRI